MPRKIKTLRPPWANLAAAGKPKQDTSARPSQGNRYTSKAHRTWRQAVLTAAAWQCRECGKVCDGEREAQADHIIPIEEGGAPYDIENGQCLCISCHSKKTWRENNGATGGWSPHPKWMPRSCIPVTVVCGPPASGKSHYVEKHKKPTDLVIDLDEIGGRMSGECDHNWNRKHLKRAMRQRNELLAGLKKDAARIHRKAWLIVCEPLPEHRQYWCDKLGAEEVIVFETPGHICEKRIKSDRGRRSQQGKAIAWWSQYLPRHGDKVKRPAERRSRACRG